MTLTPSDMLAIQSAIDAYEDRFPNRPSPSAAEALAWRAGSPFQRLLLWWKVVVAPRIRPASLPKRPVTKERIIEGSWIRRLLPAPNPNRNSNAAEAAEGKSSPLDAARGQGSIVLSSNLGAITRGSH
jgi:hypothetical protein